MNDKLVYSTDATPAREQRSSSKNDTASVGPTKMRLETKGRGGKAVTVLFNLPFAEQEARALMKDLQTKLGIGATLKDNCIELRGDQRDKIAAHFACCGWKLVRAGG